MYKSSRSVYLMRLSVLRQQSVDDRMINEYGAIGGMRNRRGYQSTWRKPARVHSCPPQIPHDLTYMGSNLGGKKENV
jgi:hypothetical protein